MIDFSQTPATRPRLYLAVFFGLLFFGFGSIWVFSAMARNAYMDSDYGQWTAKMQMVRECRVGDVAVIGDSRASVDIVPALLRPLSVKNFALTGATPVEGFYQLKRILDCPKPPKAILLAFAPRQYEEINWFWLHAARYGFFSFSDLEEVRGMEAGLGKPNLYKGAFGTEPPGAVKNWLYVNSFPTFNFASMLAAKGAGRGRDNNLIRQTTLATDGQHLEGTAACATDPGWEAARDSFELNPLVKLYLDRLLSLAKSRGVRVDILIPPVSAMTARDLSPGYRDGFAKFLGQVVQTYPGITLIGSPFLVMDDCSFGDQHHLNQGGAEAFTRHIAPLIRQVLASSD